MNYVYEDGQSPRVVTGREAAAIAGIAATPDMNLKVLRDAGIYPLYSAVEATDPGNVASRGQLVKNGNSYEYQPVIAPRPISKYPTLDRWQLYWILEDTGEKAAVDAFIAGLPDAADKVKYSDKSTFSRTDPLINLIVSQVSLNPPQFNAKWLEAAALG